MERDDSYWSSEMGVPKVFRYLTLAITYMAVVVFNRISIQGQEPSKAPTASALDTAADLFGTSQPSDPRPTIENPTRSSPVGANVRDGVTGRPAPSLRSSEKISKRTLVSNYNEAIRQAQVENRPLLVLLGASWCSWCKLLERDLEEPTADRIFDEWIIANVDVDEDPATAQLLGASALPSMRIIGPLQSVAARREGYIEIAELQTWLDENRQAVDPTLQRILFETNKPDTETVGRLVDMLADRAPRVRLAAGQRLSNYRFDCAPAVIQTLRTGRLVQQLCAVQILRSWNAPLLDLDPWQPETLNEQAFSALIEWSRTIPTGGIESSPQASETIVSDSISGDSDVDRAMASAISRLMQATIAERASLVANLANQGSKVTAMIRQRLEDAERLDDAAREALREVLFNALAGRKLRLEQAGTLAALARLDSETHRQASSKLMDQVTILDQPLLDELSGDADPLVRELAVRSIAKLGLLSNDDRVRRLLSDSSTNVRTAVLRGMSEKGSDESIRSLCDYLRLETDEDLLVFGAKSLGQLTKNNLALETLGYLASNASWRVRAAVMDACDTILEKSHSGEFGSTYSFGGSSSERSLIPEVLSNAILKSAFENDAFVAERATKVLPKMLNRSNAAAVAEALAKSPAAIKTFKKSLSEYDRNARLKPLIEIADAWLELEDSRKTEDAALLLSEFAPEQLANRASGLIGSSNAAIRHAGLKSAFHSIEAFRTESLKSALEQRQRKAETTVRSSRPSSGGLLSALGNFFLGPSPPTKRDIVETEPLAPELDAAASLFGGVSEAAAKSGTASPSQRDAAGDVTKSTELDLAGDLFGPADSLPLTKPQSTFDASSSAEDRMLDPYSIPDNPTNWLAQWQLGRIPNRPRWMSDCELGTRALLESQDERERNWARLVWLALGHTDQIEQLVSSLQTDSAAPAVSVSDTMRWLPRGPLLRLFNRQVAEVANDQSAVMELIKQATSLPDDDLAEWILTYIEKTLPKTAMDRKVLTRLLVRSKLGPSADEIDEFISSSTTDQGVNTGRFVTNEASKNVVFQAEADWLRNKYAESEGRPTRSLLLAAIAYLSPMMATELSKPIVEKGVADLQLNEVALQVLLYGQPVSSSQFAMKLLESGSTEARQAALAQLATSSSARMSKMNQFMVPIVFDYENALPGFYYVEAPFPKGVLQQLQKYDDRTIQAQAKLLLLASGESIELSSFETLGNDEAAKIAIAAALAKAERVDEAAMAHYAATYSAVKDSYQEPRLLYSLIRSLKGDEISQLRQRMRTEKGSNLFQ